MRVYLVLLVLFVLAGCSAPTQEPGAVTGTDGVSFSVISAPSEVFEGEEFSITYAVENKGSVDIIRENPGVLSFSANRLYLSELDTTSRFQSDSFWLDARTPFVSGESAFITAFFRANTIDRSSQMVNTGVTGAICYPYRSEISTQVCLETSRDADPGSVICRNQPVIPSTSGSPLVVDRVVTTTARSGDQILPSFRLNVRNAGSGIPSTDSCVGFDSPNVEGLNNIRVEASLLDEPLVCRGSGPDGAVRLTNGRGSVTCTVPGNSYLTFGSASANYLSVLSVNMSYSYRESIRSNIRVVR